MYHKCMWYKVIVMSGGGVYMYVRVCMVEVVLSI